MHCFRRLSILAVIATAAFAGSMPAGHAADTAGPKTVTKNQALYSGYIGIHKSGDNRTFKAVTGTWTEPTMDCSDGKALGVTIWVGLDGDPGTTLVQAGVEDGCYQGHQTGFGSQWICMYVSNGGYCGNDPQTFPNVKVVPGHVYQDTIVAPTATQPKYVFTLKDVTAGVTGTVSAPCAAGTVCQNKHAEVVTEPAGNLVNFGTIHFSNAVAVDSNNVFGGMVSTAWDTLRNSTTKLVGSKTITCSAPGPFNKTTNGFDVVWKKNVCSNIG